MDVQERNPFPQSCGTGPPHQLTSIHCRSLQFHSLSLSYRSAYYNHRLSASRRRITYAPLLGAFRLGAALPTVNLFSHDSHLSLDYETHPCYIASHPRSLRGVVRRHPEGGAGSGVLRRRLVTVRPGRPGTPPARHYDLAARSSLHGSARQLPAVVGRRAPKETEARPRGLKPPRWSAERRASRVMGRKAPRKRLACRDTARPTGARWHPNVSRRSAHPSIRVSEAKVKSPGRKKRAAGTKRCCHERSEETNPCRRRTCRGGAAAPCAGPARGPRAAGPMAHVRRQNLPARGELRRRG